MLSVCEQTVGKSVSACSRGSYRFWKVLEFKSHIFQAWKVLESGLGHGKS